MLMKMNSPPLCWHPNFLPQFIKKCAVLQMEPEDTKIIHLKQNSESQKFRELKRV
jgi:hypothetical protein